MKIDIGTSESGPVTIDHARLISTRMLIQANSGGGKSWMLRVLCERLGKTTPLIVLDWEGEFASLREKLDVLLVGRGGEVPTAVATAGALATQILEIGVSAVIDLYDLNPQEKRAYVRRFIESLMAAPKRLWRPYLVIVDEAHSLVPEAGQAESADAVNALMSQGRKRQFCGVLATQRLSKLHKDAAAEANNVLIGRCNLDLDQKRAGDVLGMGRSEYTGLRSLTEGQFYAFGPAFNFDGVKLITSADVETTHGAKALKAFRPPEPSARMRGVVDQLKDLAERSKTEVLDLDAARVTIKELRGQLVRAEREAAKVAAPAVIADQTAIDRAVSTARAEARKAWARIVREISLSASRIEKNLVAAAEDQASLTRTLESASTLLEAEPSATVAPKTFFLNEQHTTVVPKRPAMTRSQATAEADSTLSGVEQKVLNAAAWWESVGVESPDRDQLAIASQYHPNAKSFCNALGSLRSKGYINGLSLTADGRRFAECPSSPPTLEDAHAAFVARMDGVQRRVFEAVHAASGKIARADLAAATNYHPNAKSFCNALGRLRTLGLLDYQGGNVVGTQLMYPEGL